MKYIPITSDILYEQKNSIFYYCLHYYLNTQGQLLELHAKPATIKTWLTIDNAAIAQMAGVSREMARRRNFEKYVELSERSLGLVPATLFEQLYHALMTLPARSRNSTLRLYLHLYLGIRRNVVYHSGILDIAAATGISTKQVSSKIKWWIKQGLLERVGTYNFTYDKTFAYGYTLPAAWMDSKIDFGGSENDR